MCELGKVPGADAALEAGAVRITGGWASPSAISMLILSGRRAIPQLHFHMPKAWSNGAGAGNSAATYVRYGPRSVEATAVVFIDPFVVCFGCLLAAMLAAAQRLTRQPRAILVL